MPEEPKHGPFYLQGLRPLSDGADAHSNSCKEVMTSCSRNAPPEGLSCGIGKAPPLPHGKCLRNLSLKDRADSTAESTPSLGFPICDMWPSTGRCPPVLSPRPPPLLYKCPLNGEPNQVPLQLLNTLGVWRAAVLARPRWLVLQGAGLCARHCGSASSSLLQTAQGPLPLPFLAQLCKAQGRQAVFPVNTAPGGLFPRPFPSRRRRDVGPEGRPGKQACARAGPWLASAPPLSYCSAS